VSLPVESIHESVRCGATGDKGGSLMRRMRDFVVEGKRVFVGLEDSKRTWGGTLSG